MSGFEQLSSHYQISVGSPSGFVYLMKFASAIQLRDNGVRRFGLLVIGASHLYL